jgi:hypothetical protein
MASAAGLGPGAVDELAGLYPGHARQFLNGSKSLMRATTAIALARIFGVTVEYLIEGDGTAPTDRVVRKAVAAARLVRREAAPCEPPHCAMQTPLSKEERTLSWATR